MSKQDSKNKKNINDNPIENDVQSENIQATSNLEQEIIDLKHKLTRALADYQNLQRQSIEQVESMRISSLSNILKNIIDIVSDLEIATVDASKPIDHSGIDMIKAKLKKTIADEGVDVVSPSKGDDFDSTKMEAITQIDVPTDTPDLSGKVAETISAGLVSENKVLKPAKVILYK